MTRLLPILSNKYDGHEHWMRGALPVRPVLSHPAVHAARGIWSRSTRAGTSSTAPRGSVPSWNGP